MRKILYLITLITFTIYARAQETASKVASFKMPRHSVQFADSAFFEKAKTQFKSPLVAKIRIKQFKVNLEVRGVFVVVCDMINHASNETLADYKNDALWMVQMDRSLTLDFIKIDTLNNKRFIVYKMHTRDAVYLHFRSEEEDKKSIGGLLQYKITDDRRAQRIAKKLMSSFKFK